MYIRYSIHMFRYLELYRTRILISFFSIEKMWFCYVALRITSTHLKNTHLSLVYKILQDKFLIYILFVIILTVQTCNRSQHGRNKRDFWIATWKQNLCWYHPSPMVWSPCIPTMANKPMESRLDEIYKRTSKNW